MAGSPSQAEMKENITDRNGCLQSIGKADKYTGHFPCVRSRGTAITEAGHGVSGTALGTGWA